MYEISSFLRELIQFHKQVLSQLFPIVEIDQRVYGLTAGN